MLISHFDVTRSMDGDRGQLRDVLDIDRLWRLIGEVTSDSPELDPRLIQSIMSGLDYYVARRSEAGRVIGAVSIMDCTRGLAKIDSLAVDPESQRRGTGQKLAERALYHCVEGDFSTVTVAAMPSSKKIFERLGFEVFEAYDTGNFSMFRDL